MSYLRHCDPLPIVTKKVTSAVSQNGTYLITYNWTVLNTSTTEAFKNVDIYDPTLFCDQSVNDVEVTLVSADSSSPINVVVQQTDGSKPIISIDLLDIGSSVSGCIKLSLPETTLLFCNSLLVRSNNVFPEFSPFSVPQTPDHNWDCLFRKPATP